MSDLRSDYIDLCAAVRDMAQIVVAAEAARYDTPPGMASSKGETGSNVADVSNPTLDTVLDARRANLSAEATSIGSYLREITHVLQERQKRLDRAVARWEGDKADTA